MEPEVGGRPEPGPTLVFHKRQRAAPILAQPGCRSPQSAATAADIEAKAALGLDSG